ncbi:MAG: CsgG/HfaB family protein [Planctomycetota bacterium]
MNPGNARRMGFLWVLAFTAGSLLLAGCVTSGETAARDTLTKDVGIYPSPPAGIARPKVGVPPFGVTDQRLQGANLESLAADQLSTLALRTGRFQVIERTQLQKLLDEQNMEGIVRGGEMAKPGLVRGVDYLFVGKVTNLRVKAERSRRSFGLGSLPIPYAGYAGFFDYKNRNSTITAECGVDIRLVDPTTGEVFEAEFSEYKRTDTIGAIGIEILGAGAEAEADLQIDEDNKGKILRLALDDALKKMLPRLDQKLLDLGRSAQPAQPPAGATSAPAATPAPAAPAAEAAPPKSDPAATPKFCAACGAKLEPGAKFCGSCGAKVGG